MLIQSMFKISSYHVGACLKNVKAYFFTTYVKLVSVFRRIPEGTGWVIDGYPQNYNQAKLLEKALSGYDANARENQKQVAKSKTRKSSLVPDPRPPPPPREPASGIDVVILFDIEDELCLKRASGRTCSWTFPFLPLLDDLRYIFLCVCKQQVLLLFHISNPGSDPWNREMKCLTFRVWNTSRLALSHTLAEYVMLVG